MIVDFLFVQNKELLLAHSNIDLGLKKKSYFFFLQLNYSPLYPSYSH